MTLAGIGSLLVFFGLTAIAGLSGGYFRPGEWYRRLSKPTWNPPDIAFPIAWSALYTTMAVAAWLVWQSGGPSSALVPLSLWIVQLVLNALWSYLFFGLRRMDFALLDAILLWIAIGSTILAFWPVNVLAAWLMVPYLVWVSFAIVLNAALLRRNPVQST